MPQYTGAAQQNRKRPHRLLAPTVAAALACLLAGCSSGNPDALTGVNVDENQDLAAVNAGLDAVAAAPTNSEADLAPAPKASAHAEAASATATPDRAPPSTGQRSMESNATANPPSAPADQGDAEQAPAEGNDDEPSNAI